MPQSKSPRTRVLASAFFIQAVVIGMMFSYGVFLKVLENEIGWSRTLLSGASSLAILVMGLFAIVAGDLNDRFGPRWVITATSISTGIGYLCMASMTAPWQLLLSFGLLVGLGFATHDVITLSTVSTWYPKRRGLVTGIVKTGSACGQVLVPLLATSLIAAFGWREALTYLGFVVLILLIVLSQGMTRKQLAPEAPDIDATKPKAENNSEKAGRKAVLWKFCAIQFCFLPSLMAIPLHIVAHATDLGMSTERAAFVLSTLGAASIAGRLFVGFLVDVYGSRRILLGCLAMLSIAVMSLRLFQSPMSLFPVALIYGIAHGGLFTAISPSVAEYFGMRSHGSIFGTIVFYGTLSGAAGPVVAGMIFDRMQSYDLAFTILAALALVGLALAWSLPSIARETSPIA